MKALIGLTILCFSGLNAFAGENDAVFEHFSQSQCTRFSIKNIIDACEKSKSFPDLQKKIENWKKKCIADKTARPKNETIDGYVIKQDGTEQVCYSASAFAGAIIKTYFEGFKAADSSD